MTGPSRAGASVRALPGAPPAEPTSGRASTDRPDRTEGPPRRWRILADPQRSGAENMALDHALASELRSGEGVLRIYGWSGPTVSFGRNEPARGLYDLSAAEREGVDFVRRPSGGRAVLHDEELTYAVVAPVRAWGGLREAYRKINRSLVAGLRSLGVDAQLAVTSSGHRADPLTAGPCFRTPAEGEVTVNGRKLVGSAQARIGRALLQHGSILLSGTQDRLARIGPEATAEAGARPVTLRSLLGEVPTRESLVEALAGGLEEVLGGSWGPDGSSPVELETARALTDRYRSWEWTWRR